MRRISIVLTLVACVVLGVASPAYAHHNTITGKAVCNTATGAYDLTWSVKNSETDKSEVITASNRPVVPVGTTIGNGATATFVESAPGTTQGTLTLTLSARWTNGVTNTASGSLTLNGSCRKPDVVAPRATLLPGSCETRETTAFLDNRSSTVAVAFEVNGVSYTVPAGTTLSVSLGAFEGTVTVTSGGVVLASLTVSYANCVADYPWRVKKQMMKGEGPKVWTGIVTAPPGTAVTVTVTRAPTYLTVSIYVDGLGTAFARTLKATPGRTTVRVTIGTVDVEKYARLAGKPAQTAVYSGVL